jgi:hypothetical protein
MVAQGTFFVVLIWERYAKETAIFSRRMKIQSQIRCPFCESSFWDMGAISTHIPEIPTLCVQLPPFLF